MDTKDIFKRRRQIDNIIRDKVAECRSKIVKDFEQEIKDLQIKCSHDWKDQGLNFVKTHRMEVCVYCRKSRMIDLG